MRARGSALRVGIDARGAAGSRAGRGRFTRELLSALARRRDDCAYQLFARRRWPEPLDDRFVWRIGGGPAVAWHVRVAHAATRDCDVLLTDSYVTAALTAAPTVVFVHDLLALDRAALPSVRSATVERLAMSLALRRAARVVTPSHGTADALAQHAPHARQRVTVVPHGVSRLGAEPARRRAGLDVPAPFVLTVGLEPRKNVERLVRAFGALDRDFPQHSLVAVGIDGPRARRAIAAVRALGTRGRVLLDVPDAQLAELYRRCDLFCFPSLGEGFGLPVLEAMHAGAAVVASTRASLPEVGGGAVEYVDALDERALTAIIRRLLVSPERRAELGRAARDRAGTFSWDRSAAAIAGELAAAAP